MAGQDMGQDRRSSVFACVRNRDKYMPKLSKIAIPKHSPTRNAHSADALVVCADLGRYSWPAS